MHIRAWNEKVSTPQTLAHTVTVQQKAAVTEHFSCEAMSFAHSSVNNDSKHGEKEDKRNREWTVRPLDCSVRLVSSSVSVCETKTDQQNITTKKYKDMKQTNVEREGNLRMGERKEAGQ